MLILVSLWVTRSGSAPRSAWLRATSVFPRQHELEVAPAPGESPVLVGLRGRHQLLEARPCVVEMRNRLVQARTRQIGELREEASERFGRRAGLERRTHRVATARALDEMEGAPPLTVRVDEGEQAVARRHQSQRAAIGVARAFAQQHRTLVRSDARHVLHHPRRLAEDPGVDALLDPARAATLVLALDEQRLVDPAAAVGSRRKPAPRQRERLRHLPPARQCGGVGLRERRLAATHARSS